MTTRYVAICTGALLGAIALGSSSAQALTMQECSAKYKAAQTAGTIKGMKWNDFRKAECGTDASATPAPAAAPNQPPLRRLNLRSLPPLQPPDLRLRQPHQATRCFQTLSRQIFQ